MPKFIKIVLLVFIFFILLAFSLPLLFKDSIVSKIKDVANASLNGKMDFKDVSVSIFKNFPDLSLSLYELEFTSYVNQDTSSLFKSSEFVVGFSIWDLIRQKENPSIENIYLKNPEISVVQYDSLKSNLDILKETSEDEKAATSSLNLNISKFQIDKGNLHFMDKQTGDRLDLLELDHTGKYQLGSDRTNIRTTSSLRSVNYQMAGVNIINSISLNAILNLIYLKNENKFEIETGNFIVNHLKLETKGHVKLYRDSVESKIEITATENQFKDLFSLLSSVKPEDYSKIESGGQFSVHATIDGIYSELTDILPNWNFKCLVENGSIKYPAKQLKLEKVNLELLSSNQDPKAATSKLDLNTFSFLLNNQAFEGKLNNSNLKGDVKTSGHIIGQINLGDLYQFYPFDKGTEMNGKLSTDLHFSFYESAITNENYDQIQLAGTAIIDKLFYRTNSMPRIALEKASFNFNPKLLEISLNDMTFGKSDLNASGEIIQPLNMMTASSGIKGHFNIKSHLLNLTEWITPDSLLKKDQRTPAPNNNLSFLKGLDLDIHPVIDQIIYPEYDIRNLTGNYKFKEDQLFLNTMSVMVNGNQISGTGNLANIFDFMLNDNTVYGKLDLKTAIFDADLFLNNNSIATTGAAVEEALVIPDNFNFQIRFYADKLSYKPLTMNQVSGNLLVANQEIQFRDLNAGALGGKVILNGILNTVDKNEPKFNFKTDLSSIQFANFVSSIVSAKKLAPVMSYINGYFNSSVVFDGVLGKDMFPVLERLNLDGIIETMDGTLKGFKPLELMASKFKIKELQNLNLKNTKNWVTVQNGIVSLKKFTKKIEDIQLTINGEHQLTGSMDYQFLFNIPKNKVSTISQALKLEKGMEQLNQLAGKIGLPGAVPKGLNILVRMKGEILNPEFTFKLVGDNGEVSADSSSLQKEMVKELKDTIANRIENEKNILKEKADKEIKKYQDSLKAAASQKAGELLDKVTGGAAKKVDSAILNKAKDVIKDPLDSLAKNILKTDNKDVDQIKNKIKDWNPFKKEKK